MCEFEMLRRQRSPSSAEPAQAFHSVKESISAVSRSNTTAVVASLRHRQPSCAA